MMIFKEPVVFLISKPQIIPENMDKFLGEMGAGWKHHVADDGTALVEFAGRVCYCSYDRIFDNNKGFISGAVKNFHGSIFEHANYTFAIARCSRGFTHQMVRHRAGFAYSQESTHYIKYTEESARFCIEPNSDRYAADFEDGLRVAISKYNIVCEKLVSDGMGKKTACGAARQLLPQAIEAKLIITGNLRALRHFIEERGNNHNTLEIRIIACKIYAILMQEAKNAMFGLQCSEADDGYPEITSHYRKI